MQNTKLSNRLTVKFSATFIEYINYEKHLTQLLLETRSNCIEQTMQVMVMKF